MFGVERAPDVANGTVVLDDAAHGLDDEGRQSLRMNILSGLDAQIQSMLQFFEPFGCLVKRSRWNFGRGEDLLLHRDFIDVWR